MFFNSCWLFLVLYRAHDLVLTPISQFFFLQVSLNTFLEIHISFPEPTRKSVSFFLLFSVILCSGLLILAAAILWLALFPICDSTVAGLSLSRLQVKMDISETGLLQLKSNLGLWSSSGVFRLASRLWKRNCIWGRFFALCV